MGEVAQELGVPASTIRSWEERYGIRSSRTLGGHRRYSEADVAQLRGVRDLLRRRARTGGSDADLVLAAVRQLLRARDVTELTAVLVAFVRAVGGEVVPADDATGDALPLDLSFGAAGPLLARAPRPSVERLRIEEALPDLVDDARRVAALLRPSVP